MEQKSTGTEQQFLLGKHQLGQQELVVPFCIFVNVLLINY